MCDLWQNTLDEPTPRGAIPKQIDYALARLAPVRQVKLYNAGSFFDPLAIPVDDYAEIAARLQNFERVIVESHPAVLGDRCLRFRDLIAGRLEVAVGLETANPDALEKLNKRITLDTFRRAAAFLAIGGMDLRVFIMVRPPYLSEEEGLLWAQRSLDLAHECGATAATLIPSRDGNGAMEALRETGDFTPPTLRSLERSLEYGLGHNEMRVFADLWDIERLYACGCSPERAKRLEIMNRTQIEPPPVECGTCR
jgi:radical SAM enzyme (TIGR01210 family)